MKDMNDITKEQICECIAAELGCDVIDISDMDGWNITNKWDSIAHISIITKIEGCFNISIPDNEISNLTTVGKLAQYVSEILE